MDLRTIPYTLEVLQTEIRQAEEEQRDVHLSPRTAEALLDALTEAQFESYQYFG